MANQAIAMPCLFSEKLKQRTADLHVQAERSGIIRALLKGDATVAGYVSLQQSLLPMYIALETALDAHIETAELYGIVRPELYRAAALAADIARILALYGMRPQPLLPAAAAYADRVAEAATGTGAKLLAHAYVRYLGDLSGGQILKKRLSVMLSLDPACLTFYDFPEIADASAYKAEYREALDDAALRIGDIEPLLVEAEEAFRLNIRVSEAVSALVS